MPRELDFSRDLDVHRWSDHPEVNAFVDGVYEAHFEGGNSTIRKKHLKVILLDLYIAWCDDPALNISFYRASNAYRAGSRYNSLFISKITPKVVDTLIEAGLVGQGTGFFDRREGGSSRKSRIWPTETLIRLFQDARFGPLDIGEHEGRENIILRDVDGNAIEYEDASETVAMREALGRYNDLLSTTFIDIPFFESNRIDTDEDGHPLQSNVVISQADKFTSRVFNRGSFEFGGRHYGGWWQRCPSSIRSLIYINDVPTTEVDFSGHHLSLLYAQEGINYWHEVGTDPYQLAAPSYLSHLEPAAVRKFYKDLSLIAINARDEVTCCAAFREKMPTGSELKRLTNDQLGEALELFREHHPTIASHMASDAGIRLMRIDSDITSFIIDYLTRQEIPVLTIHDSYIVPVEFFEGGSPVETLKAIMQRAVAEVTSVEGVRLSANEQPEDYPGDEPEHSSPAWQAAMDARFIPTRTRRYQANWSQFRTAIS